MVVKPIFDSQAEAKEVMRKMWKLMDEEEVVTQYDIFVMANKRPHAADRNVVWHSFGAMYIIQPKKDKWAIFVQNDPEYSKS